MRKLLVLLAFMIAGSAALGAFTSEAVSQITCPKLDTSVDHLKRIRSSCDTTCGDTYRKQPSTIQGCKKSCGDTYDFCVTKYKEWDKKKAECRKPIAACWDGCPKGSDNQKCMDKCSDKFADELGKCAERAMQ